MYVDLVIVIAALVFSILALLGVQTKINLIGWACLLLSVALLIGRGVALFVK